MKKLIAKTIHMFNKNYFTSKSYGELEWWGIKDIYNGKIYFEDIVNIYEIPNENKFIEHTEVTNE